VPADELIADGLVSIGWQGIRDTIERFIDAGFSKFVLVPAEEMADLPDEVAEAAAEVLPLQVSR
jgi:hypothetical protein